MFLKKKETCKIFRNYFLKYDCGPRIFAQWRNLPFIYFEKI